MAAQSKYRPSLSSAQILHIIALAAAETPRSTMSYSVLSALTPFQAKIEVGGKVAAYATDTTPETALLTSLGGEVVASVPSSVTPVMSVLASISPTSYAAKELYWRACYEKYAEDASKCAPSEVEGAKEHMYISDMMGAEEMVEFERGAGLL